MIIFRGIAIFSLLLSLCNADSNSTMQNESSYIDKIHRIISETVIEWSDAIDTTLSNWVEKNETNTTTVATNVPMYTLENNETNTTTVAANVTVNTLENNETNTTTVAANVPMNTLENKVTNTTTVTTNVPVNTLKNNETNTTIVAANVPENTLEDRVKSADSFFQSNKYLDETDNTYIRVRVGSYFQSKESSDFDLTLRAQMPFRKSKKNLKIFVENITLDNAEDILKDDREAPDIGIHYFKPEKRIKSRYSIGLGGIDPFVKARYNMPIRTNRWLIDLVQSFKYSTDDKFEEETNIYFDKEVGKKSLFRIQLHRKTQENIVGMDYALSLQYYRSLKKDTGFGFGQLFFANTKYQYTVDSGAEPPQTKNYAGIHNYVTSLSWRENIWRKWFYYEVRPSVSFHKQYDYEPNYRIRLFFDFYFGKFN